MIVDALYLLMSILSGGFLAYGGWLCLSQVISDLNQPESAKLWWPSDLQRAARLS